MKGITVRGFVAAALMAALTTGCASGSTMNWLFGDWNYPLGEAHAANATKQIANPEVIDADSEELDGMDGRNVEDVMTKYHKQQQATKAKSEPSIINIGGGSR